MDRELVKAMKCYQYRNRRSGLIHQICQILRGGLKDLKPGNALRQQEIDMVCYSSVRVVSSRADGICIALHISFSMPILCH
jgi:hypothetical protein